MAKVFLSFCNGIGDHTRLLSFYEGFINGLQKNGNDVLFSCSSAKRNQKKTIKKIKDFCPDLIILFNNFFSKYDFFKEFDCPIIIYSSDSYLYWPNKEFLKNNEKCKFVVCGSNDIKSIKEEFNCSEKQISLIPSFTSIKAEKKEIGQNISFIGTFFPYPDIIKKFVKSFPSADEIKIFHKIVETVEGNPFIKEEQLKEYLKIDSDKILDILNINDFVSYISSVRRIKLLSAVADLGLTLYGNPGWIEDFNFYPEVALSYRPQQVWSIQHNQDIYNASKIGISIAHAQATSGFPWRIADIMASNACLVSDYRPDFNLYFPHVQIPTFSSPAEAHEVCKDLLENENKRADIVAACQEAINGRFRFENVLDALESFAGVTLRSANEGSVTFIPNKKTHNQNNFFDSLRLIRYSLYLFIAKEFSHSKSKENKYKEKIRGFLK